MKRVIGLGEVLWDLLPEGKQLGGAPANFAYHAHALGASAWPVTRVGADGLGTEIVQRLADQGLPTEQVQVDDTAPTGTVAVDLLPGGQHRFTIHEAVAWDRLEATPEALALARSADVICFGTLGQRCAPSRAAIEAIASAAPAEALRIFDINLRQRFYSPEVILGSLRIANILKVNDEELPVLAEVLALRGTPADQLMRIASDFNLLLVALTRGAEGSSLYADGRISDVAGSPAAVADTIGAGDAFTAAMALGWLEGWELDTINRRANTVASFVCSRPGATPEVPDEIAGLFK